jgi:hypothetical protein
MLLCPVVEGVPQAAPPSDPAIGACYLVGENGNAEWSGQDGAIACFTAGGWRFIEPVEGLSVIERLSGEAFQCRSGEWEMGIGRCREVRIGGQTVLRERQPAISDPVGGAVIDSESRASLAGVLDALRAHGLIG